MFVGDELGRVTVVFTKEGLEDFIATFNHAEVLTVDETRIITLRADEYEPGKATLVEYTTTVDSYVHA
jgi:hypothetical protein